MHDSIKWDVLATIEKFDASDIEAYARQGRFETVDRSDGGLYVPRHEIVAAGIQPYEVVTSTGNLLTTAGVTRIWNLVTNQGATQAFDSTHTRVGVGNTGNAAGSEAAGDTDLAASAGSTNRQFKTVGGAGTVSTNTLSFTATFGTSLANFAWNEWGIDQGTADATTVTAPLLNHKIVSGGLGTKTSSASWAFTVTVSLT
jgi:hypothetical protein